MLSLLVVVLYFTFGASVVAQSSSTSVVCVAGQCLQGFSNTTIGAKLSAPGAPAALLLLPGQYTATTNPQLLHNLLTSSSATLTPSPGFNSTSSPSLPLNLDLDPGFVIYASSLYSGQPSFLSLPSSPIVNSSTPLAASSLALSTNVWAAVTSGSSNNRIVIWDAVPDISQLPASASQSLSLLDVQSSACSPQCSGSGVCSAAGTCICPAGFAGSSCETCAENFFGPTCQPCPQGCGSCDQGISGSGRCLTPIVTNAPSTCNCLNGQCGTNGQCTCNPGWIKASNGTNCATCAPGFFLTSAGDCQVCQLGCSSCTDITATCTTCKTGFTSDANDKSKCDPLPSTIPGSISGTTQTCPDGSFGNGQQCTVCSPSCGTCSGASSNDCTGCNPGQFLFGGNCVSVDAHGVCQGTNGMIADNVKKECDTCGAKCTSCSYTSFNAGSITSQIQCTGCLPGFVLSQGQCVASCPTGTFVSPKDNLTCTACSSSCSTCSGSADFCLTCTSGLLASSGQCVSTCPSTSFSSSGSCIKCHPDCGSCSGPAFNQCTSCNANRPALANGRCLPTCSKSQYFDKTSSSCQTCDSSCSSCLGPGPSSCLACASSTQVLRGGSCVAANCNGASNVIPGLGVCLSELVITPSSTGGAVSALPTITGLGDPTVLTTRRPLEWWQILLMALGCAFIFVVILMLCRRRARKQRAKRTKRFAEAKKLDNPQGWRRRLVRFGERLFGAGGVGNRLHRGQRADEEALPVAYNHHDREERERPSSVVSYSRDIKLKDMGSRTPPDRSRRETRDDVEKFIDSYDYSRSSHVPSLPEGRQPQRLGRRIEQDSLYAEVTGNQRHTPEPRQPLKREPSGASRFSEFTKSSASTSSRSRNLMSPKEGVLVDLNDQGFSPPSLQPQMTSDYTGPPTTEAQRYMMAVRPMLSAASTPSVSAYLPQPQANVGTMTTGSGLMPISVTLTPNGQGSYWLSPVVPTGGLPGQQQPFQPQLPHLQLPHPSEETVVLQPMNTGGSSSKNPFRQGMY